MSATDEREAWRELHRATVRDLANRLEADFGALLRVTRASGGELSVRPTPDSWSPLEVLEHVTLTNYYLLLLAEKIATKSRGRLKRKESWPIAPPLHDHIAPIATDRSAWKHPDHMTPGGGKDVTAVRGELVIQRKRCLTLLSALPSGEGTLHRIRVSVLPEGEDRLDLYQMLDFLGRHAERHLGQIARARTGAPATP